MVVIWLYGALQQSGARQAGGEGEAVMANMA